MSGSFVSNIPVGVPQLFRPGPIPYSFMAVPASTGTVLIEKSEDNGTTFVAQPLGAVATVNTVGGYGSMSTVIRCSAFTAAGTAVLSDLGFPQGGAFSSLGGQLGTILLNGIPYTTQVTLTTELELLAMRFPVGVLHPNFRIEAELGFVCTNNVNVKTIKAYFGNSANTALEGGTICATQVLTSLAGGRMGLVITGRNDNITVDCENIGSALGWGASTTASISVGTPNANYAGPTAQEQALVISYQKATAADALQLIGSKVTLFQ